MYFFTVWMLNSLECMSNMTWLSSTFLSVPFPKALWRRSVVSITRRRLPTIAAVLGEPIFQALYSSCQEFEIVGQFPKQLYHCLFSLLKGSSHIFVVRELIGFHNLHYP